MTTKTHLSWSLLRNFGIRFGSVIVFFILARLLPPEQLGLFAAALVVINFAEIFSDSGFGDAIAQRQHVTNKLLNTALVINVLIAVFAFLILFTLSDFIAAMINAPESAQLLKYISFGLLINAVGCSAQAYYRQKMEFKWLAVRSLISMTLGATVGVAMAFGGAGIWSFVAQFMITAIANTIIAWVKVPWYPKLQIDNAEVKKLFKFGKNIILSKVLDFFATRSIEIFVIACFGPAILAVYVMGQKIYSVVMQLLAAVTLDVMLPTLAKLRGDTKKLQGVFFNAFDNALFLISPFFVLLALNANELTKVVFGANGFGAGNILFLFSLLGAVQVVTYLNSSLLQSIGKPHIPTCIVAVKAFFTLGLMMFFDANSIQEFIQWYVFFSAMASLITFYYIDKIFDGFILHALNSFSRYVLVIFFIVLAHFSVEYLDIKMPLLFLLVNNIVCITVFIMMLLIFEKSRLKGILKPYVGDR